jgi:hypothetical protein
MGPFPGMMSPGYPMPMPGQNPYMPPMYPMGYPGSPPGMYPYPPMPPKQLQQGSKSTDGNEQDKTGDGEQKDEKESQTADQSAENSGSGPPNNNYNMPPHMFPPNQMPMMMPYPQQFGQGGFPMNPAFFMNPAAMAAGRFRPPQPIRAGIVLAMACDVEQLSDYQVLVRQQLELFEAAQEDVESNTQGRKKPVALGQVGLRCRHCAPYPLRARGRGAVYYPAKLYGIYQAAQNMAGSHLCQSCQHIPLSLKNELKKLRERRDNASGGKQYWADGCRALGLYEDDNCLRLRRSQNQQPSP